MIGKFSSFEEWRKAGLHLTRCGLRILTIVGLSFVLIGANPAGSAQAAPITGQITFNLTAYPSADYVCLGETMTFRVTPEIQLKPRVGDTLARFDYVRGVRIFSQMVEGEGSITPGDDLAGGASNYPYDPNSVTFTFKAGNTPGVSKVGFDTYFSNFYVGDGGIISLVKKVQKFTYATVDVRKCSYRVAMFFTEPVPGMGSLDGTALEEELNQVSNTHYSGATELKFVYNFTPEFSKMGCPITAKIDPVVLEYTADLTNENLNLNFSFPGLNPKTTITDCRDGSKSGGSYLTQPGGGTVKVSSKGGVGKLVSPYWTYWFIVTREPQ